MDGFHPKGVHKWKFLKACGIDANNDIYSISYVIVEIKSSESWNWFVVPVCINLEIEWGQGWTSILDEHPRINYTCYEDTCFNG